MKKWLLVFVCLAALALTGCGPKKNEAFTPPPPEVTVVTVSAEPLPLISELPGRIEPVRVAQVRARITGVVLKQNFNGGDEVKAGDILYEIDPAPLKAAYNSARANLYKARATAISTQAKARRFKRLVAVNAVSRQENVDVQAASMQAQAEVEAAAAAVEMAKLNLGYATVTAPISGRAGTPQVTEGALVNQNEATAMAIIQQMDPIYCDFSQSSVEFLNLRRNFEDGTLERVSGREARVTLILEDGTVYPQDGKLLFSDASVDPSTGMFRMRAEFPNPERILLPGMYARVRVEQAVNAQAITAPQRAITPQANGTATALVVGQDNKVEARTVKTGDAIGDRWVISEGLRDGERVIVEGHLKARPGSEVNPAEAVTAETPATDTPQQESTEDAEGDHNG